MKDDNPYQMRLMQVKKQIDDVSSSFCVAKWKQVTMHLQNGHTHSCHHPRTHLVSLDEIEKNPTALHNSEYKKEQRKLMLNGERPSECDYCWKVEDQGNNLSDRIYKSAENDWAAPYINDIVAKPWDDNVDPSYVEVSFGNVCNFKCSYCAPHISSQWMEEIEKYGAYPTTDRFNNLEWIKSQKMMPIPNKDDNPYVDAFWKWWPTMYKDLKRFRITGGEPLLNKNTFKVLDYIIENPNLELEIGINTNMNPPPEIFDKFLDKIKIIIDGKKVKNLKLYTSAEAHGKQAEYIRFGMNYDEWLSNIHKTYKKIPEIQFTIMSTYNILSVTSYTKFLNDILEIKNMYGRSDNLRIPMLVDIPYLRFPDHQAIFIIKKDMLNMIHDQVTYMYKNLEYSHWSGTANQAFYEFEAEKLKRIYYLARDHTENEQTNIGRRNFVAFIDEHDRRRGTNFVETFPELGDFYSFCKTC
jgi:organic radical activating enzyme